MYLCNGSVFRLLFFIIHSVAIPAAAERRERTKQITSPGTIEDKYVWKGINDIRSLRKLITDN